MSKESAAAFAQAAMEDTELRERTAKLAPEELLPIAREMGYDFTAEELEAAMNEDRELTLDELDSIAGGHVGARFTADQHMMEQKYLQKLAQHCGNQLSNPLHKWVQIGHEERWLFWAWTRGYDILKCSLCGEVWERRMYEDSKHIG